jgi:hypothetical protein
MTKIRLASANVVYTLSKVMRDKKVTRRISYYGQRSLSDAAINYQQKVEWLRTEKLEDIKYAVVECTCNKVAGVGMEQPDCKGNCNGTICYHSLAALVKKAGDKGQTLSLFDNFSDAARYANFGGQLIKIVSSQGSGQCWAVSKKKETMQDRVEWMRGPVEEGID